MTVASRFADVAAPDALAEGMLLGVTLPDGTPVCVFNDRGLIGAVGNHYTHADFLLSDGVLHADGTLECIWHGARFDCRTGAVGRHPATEPMSVHPVRVEGDRVLVATRPSPSSAVPS